MLCLLGLPVPLQAEDLLSLYQAALRTNPILAGSDFDVERSKARKDQAKSSLLPQISGQAYYSRNHYDPQHGDIERYGGKRVSVQARQALFDLPAYYSVQAARERVQQSRSELEAKRIQLSGELIDRYLEVLTATDEIGYLRAEREAADSQRDRLRRMFERQLVKAPDLYEVEAYVHTLEARAIEVANARLVALEKLRETAGIPVRDIPPLLRVEFPRLAGSADDWADQAVHNSPNLAALENAARAEQRTVSSARAERLPQLALTASATRSDLGFDNRQNPRFDVGSIGLQLNVPFYAGGGVSAAIRESVASYGAARQHYEEKRREIERQVRSAYVTNIGNQARMSAATEVVRSQEKARDAQRRGYELNVVTIVDLLDAQRRLLRARTDLSQARIDFVRSFVLLRTHAGALSDADIEEISSSFGAAKAE